MQKVIWTLLAFALVLFVILDQGLLSLPSLEKEAKGKEEIKIAAKCVLSRTACLIELPDGLIIELTASQDVIKALEPLDVAVRFASSSSSQNQSLSPNGLKLHFAGREMEMGSHYLIPKPGVADAGEQQIFQGMIPVCSVDPRMAWDLIVRFQLNNNTFIVSTVINASIVH